MGIVPITVIKDRAVFHKLLLLLVPSDIRKLPVQNVFEIFEKSPTTNFYEKRLQKTRKCQTDVVPIEVLSKE